MRVKHQATAGLNTLRTRVDIKGFAADNLDVFSTSVDPVTLPRTEATVLWDIQEPWSTIESSWHDTPDITDIIQEIIDRPGWKAGNALGIAFDARPDDPLHDYNRGIYARDSGQDVAPVLFVRYAP